LIETTATSPSRTSSPVRLGSFFSSAPESRPNRFSVVVSARRNPSSWVPTVGGADDVDVAAQPVVVEAVGPGDRDVEGDLAALPLALVADLDRGDQRVLAVQQLARRSRRARG
jgi:hypothetical protein